MFLFVFLMRLLMLRRSDARRRHFVQLFSLFPSFSSETTSNLMFVKPPVLCSFWPLCDWVPFSLYAGGPLEGLQQSSGGVDPGTTYADLVSRAAIVDSCDERSYSEGGASSDAALAAVGSSQDDAFPSGTPRCSWWCSGWLVLVHLLGLAVFQLRSQS